MAYLIKADNTVIEVKPKNGTKFTLEELQGFVGGLIELVNVLNVDLDGTALGLGKIQVRSKTHMMFINEEGKIDELPYNRLATLFFVGNDYDQIVGDVILLTTQEAGD